MHTHYPQHTHTQTHTLCKCKWEGVCMYVRMQQWFSKVLTKWLSQEIKEKETKKKMKKNGLDFNNELASTHITNWMGSSQVSRGNAQFPVTYAHTHSHRHNTYTHTHRHRHIHTLLAHGKKPQGGLGGRGGQCKLLSLRWATQERNGLTDIFLVRAFTKRKGASAPLHFQELNQNLDRVENHLSFSINK